MEYFFDNLDTERAFVTWFQGASKDYKKSIITYAYSHVKETIEYREYERLWPFPPKIIEISRKKEILDNDYPTSKLLVNSFLKSYGIATYEKTKYIVGDVPCDSKQDAEAKFKNGETKVFLRAMGNGNALIIEAVIHYQTCIDISNELEKTLSAACKIGHTKLLLYSSYSFFERVRQNPKVKVIQQYLEESDIGRGFYYEIFKTSIGYFDHIGQEDENHVSYSSLGLKELQSDSECCGLGFAIAELFLEKQGIDIKTGILEQKIDVGRLHITGNYYAITFRVDSGKKEAIRELHDW